MTSCLLAEPSILLSLQNMESTPGEQRLQGMEFKNMKGPGQHSHVRHHTACTCYGKSAQTRTTQHALTFA
eukprot:729602-Pelagomonas_calceolata.AAC.3